MQIFHIVVALLPLCLKNVFSKNEDDRQNRPFNPANWEGPRQETMLNFLVDHQWTYPMEAFPSNKIGNCIGIIVAETVVVAPCSCFTYNANPDLTLSVWNQAVMDFGRVTLEIVPVANVKYWKFYKQRRAPDPVKYNDAVEDIILHELCNNWYEVDSCLVKITQRPQGTRLAWIHTAESLLFDLNFHRVIANQAVEGKCTVVWKEESPRYGTVFLSQKVYFMPWSTCQPLVCPSSHSSIRKPIKIDHATSPDNEKRCNNEMQGSRYCIQVWDSQFKLCNQEPGTPVFCDVGNIHGFFGFIVHKPYFCPRERENIAVLQAFSDQIPTMREYFDIVKEAGYVDEIPEWVKIFNKIDPFKPGGYIHGPAGKRYMTRPTKPRFAQPEGFDFSWYRWRSASIIDILNGNANLCHGTLVTHTLAIAPCSCLAVTLNEDFVVGNYKNPKHTEVSPWSVKFMRARLALDNWKPGAEKVKIVNVTLHPKCDNHFMYDYGMVILERALERSNLAWIATSNSTLLGSIIRQIPIINIMSDVQCDLIEFSQPKSIGLANVTWFRIRLVNFDLCAPTVCDAKYFATMDEVRCFNNQVGYVSAGGETLSYPAPRNRYCAQAIGAELCSKKSGSPVFCQVEEGVGLIGFLSKSHTFCTKDSDRSTAVLFSIDEYLDQFVEKTGIWKVEKLAHRLAPQSFG